MIDFINKLGSMHLTHPLIALVIFHVALLLSGGSVLIASAIPIAFYWGRELRDTEINGNFGVASKPLMAIPLFWKKSELLGFWPVVGVVLALFGIWTFVL